MSEDDDGGDIVGAIAGLLLGFVGLAILFSLLGGGRRCPHCRNQIPSSATVCPHCRNRV